MSRFLSFFAALLTTSAVLAQSTFSARVVDAESGERLPLVGVYIFEERNTLTNFDGEFSIRADSTDVLHITCVGRRSISIQAAQLPAVIRMELLESTLAEVTVKAVEGLLLQVAAKTEKAFNRRRKKEAQYFYRQTSVFGTRQDIVEAFIEAHSAVHLRKLKFLSGRHGILSRAAWEQSPITGMNLHHLLEIAPMTKEASFWRTLIMPLSPKEERAMMQGRKQQTVNGNQPTARLEYLQHYYKTNVENVDGDGQHLYRISLLRNEETEIKQPIMTGTLYVDRVTLSPLAFDGQVENLTLSFGQGELRSATVVPVTFSFHLDYRYDHNYPEVADMSVQTQWEGFLTRTMLFNVEGQRHLTKKQKKRITGAGENMLSSIHEAGYDSTFWADNDVIKRTAEEEAIAQGNVERTQARLDSAAAAQAALPPLERLADRLARFGQAIPQEKVYIHMDNTSYFLGDTIWFAAYTRRTNNGGPSRISRVLYCELWNHDGYLVERKLVEMKEGRGHGFFELPDTLYSGYFELRAYTRWQLNWGQTEHYHAWSTEYWFYNKAMAKDFFRDYEKLYSRVFPVYDKPKTAGDYYRDMTFRPLRRYFPTEQKQPELRLSLFPEGGNLVAGVPCRVAFEAATSEGEVVEGQLTVREKRRKSTGKRKDKNQQQQRNLQIQNEGGAWADHVCTENRGRGTFVFTPQADTDYEVVFTTAEAAAPDDQDRHTGAATRTERLGTTAIQQIKAVKPEGIALQVHHDSISGQWIFDIAATGQVCNQPLGTTVMSEGVLRHFEELKMDSSSTVHHASFSIPEYDLSPGVHQVTVFDSIGHIYADRLFFATRSDLVLPTLRISGAQEQYAPWQPIDFDVTSAHVMPDQVISLSVRDAAHSDNTFDSGTILTEMLLASEIKGFVPQPEYFFERDDQQHRRALDLLMMTQGWRRFNWQDMAVKGSWELTHPAEHTQIVSGTVNRYWTSDYDRRQIYDDVPADYERFMTEYSALPDQQLASHLFRADGRPGSITGSEALGHTEFGRRNMAWNLSPIYERRNQIGAISDTQHGIYSLQGNTWENTNYNVLRFSTSKYYDQHQRQQRQLAARRYVESGTVKKEVRVHAEFVNPDDPRDSYVGEVETTHGRFQIDLPRFQGECLFYLGASDTTLWKKKWDGLRRRKPHSWVKIDEYDEYDAMADRIQEYPEYYVRLNFPYPRWIRPYTFYQVHNAPLRDTTYLSPRLLTDGTNVLEQITVRTRHGGLRKVDLSKPAYVIDAYEAMNIALDAGLATPSQSIYSTACGIVGSLISDMGMHRHYNRRVFLDGRTESYNYGPLEQLRFGLLTNIDKIYIYTDYSPRREGDKRYSQDNQPEVVIDIRRYPDKSQRVTYRDRRYILPGFAFQEDFYHPDYRRNPPTEGQRDYRRTLYWNPELKLDARGQAHVCLYNNSQQTTIAIDAAGQTAEGHLLHTR